LADTLGRRIHEQVCHGLLEGMGRDPEPARSTTTDLSTINPEHQQFLINNMESFLFGQGTADPDRYDPSGHHNPLMTPLEPNRVPAH
jgi:Fe-S cluster biosynthesis and repair protein YggX